jgi:hypothetical protein
LGDEGGENSPLLVGEIHREVLHLACRSARFRDGFY